MVLDISKIVKVFSGGTISCAIAHNLGSLENVVDPAVLGEASKTGAVLAALTMLRIAGGITLNSGKGA